MVTNSDEVFGYPININEHQQHQKTFFKSLHVQLQTRKKSLSCDQLRLSLVSRKEFAINQFVEAKQ